MSFFIYDNGLKHILICSKYLTFSKKIVQPRGADTFIAFIRRPVEERGIFDIRNITKMAASNIRYLGVSSVPVDISCSTSKIYGI